MRLCCSDLRDVSFLGQRELMGQRSSAGNTVSVTSIVISVNLRAASAMSLTIPSSILIRADEVIE